MAVAHAQPLSASQSSVGDPNKGVHYTPSVCKGQCPLSGLWLLTCHITNIILIFRACWRNDLDLEAVKWKSIAKVGVAPLRTPTLVMRNCYPHTCPNPLRFLVFHLQTAHQPVSHMKYRNVPFSTNLQHSYRVKQQNLY